MNSKRIKPLIRNQRIDAESPNKTFCMAPWRHAHISPQGERRMCCVSREDRKPFKKDETQASGVRFQAETLPEYWNSEDMKAIRRAMLAGENLPECIGCDDESLTVWRYRDCFTGQLFAKDLDQAFASTAEDGSTTMMPVSYDYRLSNHCNFKCRTCLPEFSSAWEQEVRKNDLWNRYYEYWVMPEVSELVKRFQKEVVEEEFAKALRAGLIEEIYWAGGEPLAWEAHWRFMRELVDLGYSKQTRLRYNTNLYRIENRGVNLVRDLLPNFKDWTLNASIDGGGRIGEYIRTGLNWEKFKKNFEAVLDLPGARSRLILDMTITGPGLFALKELVDQAIAWDARLDAKLMHASDSSMAMSPLIWPKQILHSVIDELLRYCRSRITIKQQGVVAALEDLKMRPSFEVRDPAAYPILVQKARMWMQKIDLIRRQQNPAELNMDDVYAQHPELQQWWRNFAREKPATASDMVP